MYIDTTLYKIPSILINGNDHFFIKKPQVIRFVINGKHTGYIHEPFSTVVFYDVVGIKRYTEDWLNCGYQFKDVLEIHIAVQEQRK